MPSPPPTVSRSVSTPAPCAGPPRIRTGDRGRSWRPCLSSQPASFPARTPALSSQSGWGGVLNTRVSVTGRQDPHSLDGPRGHRLPDLLLGQRRVEFRGGHVGGAGLRGAALLEHDEPGRECRSLAGRRRSGAGARGPLQPSAVFPCRSSAPWRRATACPHPWAAPTRCTSSCLTAGIKTAPSGPASRRSSASWTRSSTALRVSGPRPPCTGAWRPPQPLPSPAAFPACPGQGAGFLWALGRLRPDPCITQRGPLTPVHTSPSKPG